MKHSPVAAEQPRYIKLNARDNVAIVVNDFGLPAGSRFACGLELKSFVPQGHKTALIDLPADAPIIRYGEVIGYAASPIEAGDIAFFVSVPRKWFSGRTVAPPNRSGRADAER